MKLSLNQKEFWNNSNQSRSVNLLDEKGNIVKIYPSMQSAAEDTDCNYVGISKCCTGKLKTYHGRRWSYAAIP